jgi:ElaB/YqjD/DUF883 family membrane-anchored ribosome-binding protein
MAAHYDTSVEELRRESERSRAALTSTVLELRSKVSDTADDLKTRLSPAHITGEVKEYVREGSGRIVHSIQRKARENPLQAIAIGAGLGFPLWGLVRAIPVPLMLVGAGLLFASRKPGSGGNDLLGAAAKVQEAGAQGADRAVQMVRDVGTAASESVGAVTDKVKAAANDTRDSVAAMASAATQSLSNLTDTAAQSISSTVSQAGSKVQEAGEQARNTFVDLVDRNPLIVAGVGLAIGAFIAASLPRSDTEDRIFGERADDLKDTARNAAATSVERAKDAAAGMVGDAAEAAAREGLSAEGLGKAVEGFTAGMKAVVDRGTKTALGEATNPPLGPQSGTT